MVLTLQWQLLVINHLSFLMDWMEGECPGDGKGSSALSPKKFTCIQLKQHFARSRWRLMVLQNLDSEVK